MIHRSNSLLLAAALSATVWFVPAASKAQAEQRCTDLGASGDTQCICSEPLDFPSALTSHPFDPPDTEGSGAMECVSSSGGKSFLTKNSQFGDVVMVTGASQGLPNVGNLPQLAGHITGSIRDDERTMTGKTWCGRSYHKWSTDFQSPCNTEDGNCSSDLRIKGPRHVRKSGDGAPLFDFQTGWKREVQIPQEFSWECKGASAFGKCETFVSSGTVVEFDDCKDSWCRIELCFDHVGGTGALAFRGRITSLDSNENIVNQRITKGDFKETNSVFKTGNSEQQKVLSFFSQGINDGTVWISHAMTAESVYDPNFWIGPASEIEGASNNPRAASPPPANPPAPPILLSD